MRIYPGRQQSVDASFNQEQDVLDAVQVMRKRAEDAGTLRTTPQQTVATQGSTIIIEPAAPDVCYLPVYDPWTVYGAAEACEEEVACEVVAAVDTIDSEQ
jgi:uncharacterized protein DUF3300